MEPLRRPVLLYDAGCRFCRFAARMVVWLDRREELALLPLHSIDAASFLESLPVAERFASWRLFLLDGSLVGYGAGGAELLQELRATRPVGRLLARAPAHILDRVYGAIARHRAGLGRIVPDGPAPRRFP